MIVMLIASCQKNSESLIEEKEEELIKKLNSIIELSLTGKVEPDFSLINCNNPNERAGIITAQVTKQVLKYYEESKSFPVDIEEMYLRFIDDTLTDHIIKSSFYEFNRIEKQIINTIIQIYTDQDFYNFNIKSKDIENIIIDSECFSELQKLRLLTFSSVFRHNIGTIREYFSGSKSAETTWEGCFKGKLRELQNCGNCFFEKIVCAFSWPTCLGVKALDCLINKN